MVFQVASFPKVEIHTTPPESWDAAVAERQELLQLIKDIDTQLSIGAPTIDGRRMTIDETAEWRRRAIWARRYKEHRAAFLKQWLRDNHRQNQQKQRTEAASLAKYGPLADGVPASAILRNVAKRVGLYEAVYLASVALLTDATEENRIEWERQVRNAMERLDGGKE